MADIVLRRTQKQKPDKSRQVESIFGLYEYILIFFTDIRVSSPQEGIHIMIMCRAQLFKSNALSPNLSYIERFD